MSIETAVKRVGESLARKEYLALLQAVVGRKEQ